MSKNEELTLQTGPYQTTLVGTEVTRPSTEKEWENYGQILKRVEEAKQWAIGDWLLDGMNHFEAEHGKNKKYEGTGLYEKAEWLTEIPKNSLMKFKSITDLFEFCHRRQNLTFEHHRTVAYLKKVEVVKDKKLPQGRMQWSKEPDKDKMQELLEEAGKEKKRIDEKARMLTTKELNELVKQYKSNKEREFALHNSPEKYDIIYADPPWEYGDKLIEEYGAAEHHYPSMTIKELCDLSVNDITADNAVLFFWVTSPLLEECFEVINAWGFQYKTSFVWDKEEHNYGHYNSVRHEFLLVCTKGSYLPQNNELFNSVQTIKRSEIHSQKPEKFREIIEEMYPNGRKIELFAREEYENWEVWGNEI